MTFPLRGKGKRQKEKVEKRMNKANVATRFDGLSVNSASNVMYTTSIIIND